MVNEEVFNKRCRQIVEHELRRVIHIKNGYEPRHEIKQLKCSYCGKDFYAYSGHQINPAAKGKPVYCLGPGKSCKQLAYKKRKKDATKVSGNGIRQLKKARLLV
jgi:hypothetical protein